MENRIRIFFFTLTLLFFAGFHDINAQGPPPPPPSGGHGLEGNQPAGNGAPVGTGMALMAGLFAAYGVKKAWDARKKLDE